MLWCAACRAGLALRIRLAVCPACETEQPDWCEQDYSPFPWKPWHVTREDWFVMMVLGIDPERDSSALPK